MAYTKIKSKLVESELKKTTWGKREYIDYLMKIEQMAKGIHLGRWHASIELYVRKAYPEQWKKIWLELNPKQYNKNLEYEKREKARERKEEAQMKIEEQSELDKEKAAWIFNRRKDYDTGKGGS